MNNSGIWSFLTYEYWHLSIYTCVLYIQGCVEKIVATFIVYIYMLQSITFVKYLLSTEETKLLISRVFYLEANLFDVESIFTSGLFDRV